MKNKLTFADIRVPNSMTFTDISTELFRKYSFSSKEEKVTIIDNPIAINVSRGGGHRVIDDEGLVHYVPKGWIELIWKPKEGSPHVVF